MRYYVLNSGHRIDLPRKPLAAAVISQLTPLLKSGGPLPAPLSNLRLEIAHADGGALFNLSGADRSFLTAGLAWTPAGAAHIWQPLEEMYYKLSDLFPSAMGAVHAPAQPLDLPWLAMVLHPGTGDGPETERNRLGAVGACLAWCILDHAGQVTGR